MFRKISEVRGEAELERSWRDIEARSGIVRLFWRFGSKKFRFKGFRLSRLGFMGFGVIKLM